MPFIIRGVKLWGINSVNASIQRRQFLWNEASKLIDFELLGKSIKEISLEELIDVYPKMLKGETSGRYIINFFTYSSQYCNFLISASKNSADFNLGSLEREYSTL